MSLLWIEDASKKKVSAPVQSAVLMLVCLCPAFQAQGTAGYRIPYPPPCISGLLPVLGSDCSIALDEMRCSWLTKGSILGIDDRVLTLHSYACLNLLYWNVVYKRTYFLKQAVVCTMWCLYELFFISSLSSSQSCVWRSHSAWEFPVSCCWTRPELKAQSWTPSTVWTTEVGNPSVTLTEYARDGAGTRSTGIAHQPQTHGIPVCEPLNKPTSADLNENYMAGAFILTILFMSYIWRQFIEWLSCLLYLF